MLSPQLWHQESLHLIRALNSAASRPSTPASLTKGSGRQTATPPPSKSGSSLSSPLSKPFHSRPVKGNNYWTARNDDGDDDDEAEANHYTYSENYDEDEFGLPSISSMRREAKRIPRTRAHDPGGGLEELGDGVSLLSIGQTKTRERANSSDIAEERGPLDYPTAKKGEGKILRPQYKDILRGWSQFSVSNYAFAKRFRFRSG